MSSSCASEDQVARAFANPEGSEKYLERILTCCKDTGAGITRLLVVLVLCIAAFELLVQSDVKEVTITFLQLGDQTPVMTFLPVVVAVLQYQIVRQSLHWRLLERTFHSVLKVAQPAVAENGLGVYLVPRIPLFATEHAEGSYLHRVFSMQYKFEACFTLLFALVVLPLFQGYAFFRLFTRAQHVPTPLLLTALALSAVMTFAYVRTIVMVMRYQECAPPPPVPDPAGV